MRGRDWGGEAQAETTARRGRTGRWRRLQPPSLPSLCPLPPSPPVQLPPLRRCQASQPKMRRRGRRTAEMRGEQRSGMERETTHSDRRVAGGDAFDVGQSGGHGQGLRPLIAAFSRLTGAGRRARSGGRTLAGDGQSVAWRRSASRRVCDEWGGDGCGMSSGGEEVRTSAERAAGSGLRRVSIVVVSSARSTVAPPPLPTSSITSVSPPLLLHSPSCTRTPLHTPRPSPSAPSCTSALSISASSLPSTVHLPPSPSPSSFHSPPRRSPEQRCCAR